MLGGNAEHNVGQLVANRESLTLRPVICIGADETLATALEAISRLLRSEISLRPDNRAYLLGILFDGNRNGGRVHLPNEFPRPENGSELIHCHVLPAKFFVRV